MTSLHKTTPEDLEGFWDMVYIQVSDIDNKFSQLAQLEDNNWEEEKKQLSRRKVDIQLCIYIHVHAYMYIHTYICGVNLAV